MSTSGPRASVEWLVSPIGKKKFFEEYWESKPLVVNRNQPNYFSSLLSLDEVDRVLTTLDLQYPNVTLKNADRKITSEDYTFGGDSLDVTKVYELFEAGATIILSYMDTVVPALTAFCRDLESEFTFPFQTNVYLTPGGAKGFKPHYDTHDVFVLQIEGSKRWTIYGTPVELPLSEQDFDPALHERGEPTAEFGLEAGDLAYIPRGFVHDARSGEVVSLHITAGVLSYTWTDLLLEWLSDLCLNDPQFRKALPPGFAREEFDREHAREIFGALRSKLTANSSLDAILDRFVGEFISARPPLLGGQMAQISNLRRLTIDSVVGPRPGAVFNLQTSRASARVECYGTLITFPAHASDALRFALTKSKFAIRELPGSLDDAGKLVLVQRLIREGLMIAFPT